MARKGSVNFDVDDHSISEKFWESFRKVSDTTIPSRSVKRESVDFNYFDKNGKTPLMISVDKNYLKTPLDLLLFGADPNIQQKETGETALHMAVDNGNIVLVKALLVFNADPTICNKHNQTPLDIAKLLKQKTNTPDIKKALFTATMFMSLNQPFSPPTRTFKDEALKGDIDGIITVLMEATQLQAKSRQYFTEHSTIPPPRNSSDTFLLSLDGGGIRLCNILQALVNIEQRMSDLTSTKQKMYSYFDYVAGTSAGGIVACSLSYLNSDANNAKSMAINSIIQALAAPAKERGDILDSALQDIFTEDRSMADLDPRYRVIVTASLAEYIPYELHFMTSYGEPRDGQAGPKERKVWEACRVTTAAPAHFPLLRDLKLLDGDLVCNNPTFDSMTEIIEQGKREGKLVKFGCVVSIGNGIPPKTKTTTDVELFAPSALSMLSYKNFHALQNLMKHVMAQIIDTDGLEITSAQSFCEALGCQYFRLSPPLKEDVSMSTVDEVMHTLYDTQMYYLDNPELIDGVAKYLLSK